MTPPRIGILCSRVRVEEKLLLQAFRARGAEPERIDDAEVGEIVTCPECGADLEIRGLAPARLDVAPPEEEDWGE